MSRSSIASYWRAQEGFDAVLATVPSETWDWPSACPQWTLRDVVGHVVWAQEQLRHWATEQDYANRTGAPGAPHPAEMAGADPLATWRGARAATLETLTGEALSRRVNLPGLGRQALADVLALLVTDHLVHTWDIGHPLGLDVRLDIDLVAGSFAWAHDHVVRVPRPVRSGAAPSHRCRRADALAGVPGTDGVATALRVMARRDCLTTHSD